MINYLLDIPESAKEYGLCKILAVRRDSIHLKHIFTELFVRKTINLEKMLEELEMSMFEYMEIMTDRFRSIYHFNRQYSCDFDRLMNRHSTTSLFECIELYQGMNNLIALDFDGVITDYYFQTNFLNRFEKFSVVSANPTIKRSFFDEKDIKNVDDVFACKGKIKKIKKLIELSKRYDQLFFIDNEEMYLQFAWIFGIKTYQYIPDKKKEHKIRFFTMKTK